MQVPGAERLWRQSCPEPLQALLGEQCVVDHPGQVRHPGQRRQARPNGVQQVANLGLVTDVGRERVDPAVVALA